MRSSTRSLHVAFVIPALFGNGAERSVLRIARGLVSLGHKVDLLLLRPVVDCPDEVPPAARMIVMEERIDESTKNSVSAVVAERPLPAICFPGKLRLRSCVRMLQTLGSHPLTLPNISMFKEAQFVANYVRKEDPDCVVPILPKGKVATLLAKTLLSSFPAVVSSVHSNLQNRRRREVARYRLLLRRSDHVVAVSHGVRSSVIRVARISPDKISSIYNPVVAPDILELAELAPGHPWLTDGDPAVILAAGRLAKVKDFPTLIRAFYRVSTARTVRLIILGEGPQRAGLQTLVCNLNLEGRVSLPGYVDNPYAFMSRASLFVLSSKFEGLANVLIEALACGCPCVSTDCPSGPAEILDDGRIGPLVPVGDHVMLADEIQRMLDAPPDRGMLQRRAALFSVENSVAAYEKVIMRTVSRSEASSALQGANHVD